MEAKVKDPKSSQTTKAASPKTGRELTSPNPPLSDGAFRSVSIDDQTNKAVVISSGEMGSGVNVPRNPERRCVKCGVDSSPKYRCSGRYVCEPCLERIREGRDLTTKTVKHGNPDVVGLLALPHIHREGAAPACGSVALPADPKMAGNQSLLDQVALDAGIHRMDLLSRLGTDCVASAIDTAKSTQAGNSLEISLAHQLAVAHTKSLEIVDQASLQENIVEKCRLFNLAARFMDTFQRGLLTLQRIRAGGAQTITIHHVNVGQGGQAIVGNVRAGGGGKK